VTTSISKANKDAKGAAYFEAKKYLTDLLAGLGITEIRYLPYEEPTSEEDKQAVRPFDSNRSSYVMVGNSVLGILGEYKPSVRRSLKLSASCAGFELDIDLLLPLVSANTKSHYVSLSRFPKVEQDICLKVPAALSYQQVYDFVWNNLQKEKPERTSTLLSPVDIYQREDDSSHKQITLRLDISSYERTMTDEAVNALLDNVAVAAKAELQAERL
jgi:phenylalanyl-tRNA synthetase beta subunit